MATASERIVRSIRAAKREDLRSPLPGRRLSERLRRLTEGKAREGMSRQEWETLQSLAMELAARRAMAEALGRRVSRLDAKFGRHFRRYQR